jgi:hypothetical protein
LILSRNNLFRKVIIEWYDSFGISAFVADICSIMFGVFLALYLFKYVFPAKWFNLTNLLLTVVLIQMTHDLLFALFISKIRPSSNSMIHIFEKYIDENSWYILLVDAIMMISTVLIAYSLLKTDNVLIYTLIALLLYIAQFFIVKS